MKDVDLKELVECKHLQELNLNGCVKVTDRGLKELGRSDRQLRSLYLQAYCGSGDCEWIEGVDRMQTPGKLLIFAIAHEVTDGTLIEVAALKLLRSLYLRYSWQVTDAGVKELAACKQLQ